MKRMIKVWGVFLVVAVLLSSCNFPLTSGNSDTEISTIVAIQVAQTQLAGTMGAGNGGVPTVEGLGQQPSEPTLTPTITLTPEPSLTPTPEGVWLTVVENTNCRKGPGKVYDYVSTIKTGQQVQAVGRSPDNQYYYVQNINGNGYCWLWVQYSTLTGNTGILPVFTPAPTPTFTVTPSPAPGISVSFVQVTTCGPQYALRLMVRNTGSVTWQSVKVTIVDNDTATTFVHSLDQFRGYAGCPEDLTQEDLTPGEEGVISNVNPGQFNYDPTGHSLNVTVTVYSENGLAGQSYSTAFNLTP